MNGNAPIKAIIGLVTIIFVVIIGFGSFTVVPEGHVGIKDVWTRGCSTPAWSQL